MNCKHWYKLIITTDAGKPKVSIRLRMWHPRAIAEVYQLLVDVGLSKSEAFWKTAKVVSLYFLQKISLLIGRAFKGKSA